MLDTIGDAVWTLVYRFFLLVDSIIYNLINYAYEIFIFLAKLNLFDEEDYNDIVKKIYLILGVIMLFVLAYSLLKAVISPDDFSKGDNSVPNIIKNVVISLIIITLLPTVFTLAFNIQGVVLNSDVIPKIIFGNENITDIEEAQNKGGNLIAYNTFYAFFKPNVETCLEEQDDPKYDGLLNIKSCSQFIAPNKGSKLPEKGIESLYMLYEKVELGEMGFTQFGDFTEAIVNEKISYMIIVSSVIGIIELLIILAYCIDLAVRVIKLAFYQIIAPIPVICRVMPGDKKKAFDTWVSQTIHTFLDVFVRVAVMYLGIYLITMIVDKFSAGIPGINSLGITQRFLVLVFLIIGILLFVKQAPKMVADLFGFKSSGELNPVTKMLGIGAAFGGGITGGVRNARSAIRKGMNIPQGIGSMVAGALSGAVRGGYNARNAHNLNDMRNAAGTGARAATDARDRRAAYRTAHGGSFRGSMLGHVQDVGRSIGDWSTGTGTVEFDERIAKAQEYEKLMDDYKKEIEKLVEKNMSNQDIVVDMVAQGLFKGDANTKVRLEALFNSHGKNMSLDQLQSYIKSEEGRQIDFEAQVDKTPYVDSTGRFKSAADENAWRTKVENLKMDHAQKLGDLNNMYQQMKKASEAYVGDQVMRGNSISGIPDFMLDPAKFKGEAWQNNYKLGGNQVSFVNTDGSLGRTFGELDLSAGSENIYNQMDLRTNAAKSGANYARTQKSKYQAQRNNNNNKK